MTCSPTLSLATLCARAYKEAYAYHGDLDLDAEVFGRRVRQIIAEHLEPGAEPEAEATFFAKLHKNDLYLTCACASSTGAGWDRFLRCYRRTATDLACSACGSVDLGQEVADRVLTDLCLPDRHGRPRIGSYDGRVPLAAWLHANVWHQALKERKRKHHYFERLEELPDYGDALSAPRLEARLRDRAYREVILAALGDAIRQLSERERLILLLRYEEGLQREEVARILRVNPSTISRGQQAAQQKLKGAVMTSLTERLNGRLSDIHECLIDLRENPSYSLLALLKEAAPARPCPSV